MQLSRIALGLCAAVFVFATANAAHAQNLQPFGPLQWEPDGQPFAPPELSTYGNGPSLNYGWYFQYDRLYWTISQPKYSEIGVPVVPPSANPNALTIDFAQFNRFQGNPFIVAAGGIPGGGCIFATATGPDGSRFTVRLDFVPRQG